MAVVLTMPDTIGNRLLLEAYRYNRKMLGPCGLCGKTEDLQLSHLIPQSIYRLLRTTGKPVVNLTTDIAISTDKEIRDNFLCGDCEDRFSKNGERWVAANCYRPKNRTFILQNVLRKAQATGGVFDFRLYDGLNTPGVNMSKLVYFAVSVFWRAAAHKWPGGDEQLSFGPYLDPLRRFLLGEIDLPKEAIVIVGVSPLIQSERSASTPTGSLIGDCHRYYFGIPGIGFQLLLGKRIPSVLRSLCAHKHGILVVTPINEQRQFQETLRMMATAQLKNRGR
jgi:hypothetical protein